MVAAASRPSTRSRQDYATDPDTRRSVSGFAWFYGPGATVAASSKMQKTVTNSTVEAEWVALNEGAREGLYLYHLLKELGENVPLPLVMYEDSTGAVYARRVPGTCSN